MKGDPFSLGMQLHHHRHRIQNSENNLCLVLRETKDFSRHGKGRGLSSVPHQHFLIERNRRLHHRLRCYRAHR